MGIVDFFNTLFDQPPPGTRARRYWLFYAGPENYLCASGVQELNEEIFWSCESETRKGDLILLYRKSINQRTAKSLSSDFQMPLDVAKRLKQSKVGKDFPAIWEARENAQKRSGWGWEYGCTAKEVRKIDPPLTLDQLKADPRLMKWEGLRWNLQANGRSALEIPQDSWDVINSLISASKR